MSYPVKPPAGGLSLFTFPESVNTSFKALSLYGYFLKISCRGRDAGLVRALLQAGLGSALPSSSHPHPSVGFSLAVFPCRQGWANSELMFSA